MIYEFEKLIFKQKGLLIIVIMLIIKAGIIYYSGYDSNYIIDKFEDGYADYINQYRGKVTDETSAKIKDEYNSVNRAREAIDKLSMKWKNGDISQEDYESQSIQYYEKQKNSTIFQVIYSQYTYASKQPEERFILDSRGWETLLIHDTLDFSLLLCLVALLTPLFCSEYESNMDILLLSTRRGRYQTGVIKLLIGSILAVIITLIFNIMEYFYLNMTVGLDCGNYPLQSLKFFVNSSYRISLIDAYLLILLVRILGAVMLSCFVSLIGILSKKSIITLVLSTLLFILPAILFSKSSTRYYIPLPTGLLQSTGYLWGSSYNSIYDSTGKMIKISTYEEISHSNFKLLIIFFVIEIILLFLYSLKVYSHYTLSLKQWRVCLTSGISILFFITISGCDNVYDEKDTFTFISEDSWSYGQTKEFEIKLEIDNNNIIISNKENGQLHYLLNEVFPDAMWIKSIFVRDNYCYYLMESNDAEMYIYGINLNDFSEVLVFSSIRENNEEFYGLISNATDAEIILQNMEVTSCFFLNNRYIYIMKGSTILQINRKTYVKKTIIQDAGSNKICYNNGSIYYIDQQYRLSEFNEQTKQIEYPGNIYTDNFTIRDNRIEYYNLFNDKQMEYYNILNK